MVPGLQKGCGDARENPPIKPVSDEVVSATLVELLS
jgi:hypothetical protein